MTAVFGLFAFGALLIYSGSHNESIIQTLTGLVKPPTQKNVNETTPKGQPKNDSQAQTVAFGGGGNRSGLLPNLAAVASKQYGLSVREYAPYDKVDPVHSPGSWHYKGRAMDVSGDRAKLRAFVTYAVRTYGPGAFEEFIYNDGAYSVSIDGGKVVGKSFWAGSWARHTGHAHIAI